MSWAYKGQELRLLSWDALPRIDKTIPFPWEAGKWYRAKLTTEQANDKLIVRGKVWPCDAAEPDAWTVEVTNPRPNREGSAGLYGYATGIFDDKPGTSAFYDNVSVTLNT